MKIIRPVVPLLSVVLLCCASCAAPQASDGAEDAEAEAADGEEAEPLTENTGTVSEALTRSIPYETFDDYAETESAQRALRVVITSRRQYIRVVGHEPRVRINFRREWVIFYSAGIQRTGGYVARITDIAIWTPDQDDGRDVATLVVRSRLRQPGSNCFVPQVLTIPQVFARIDRPRRQINGLSWSHRTVTRDCRRDGGDRCEVIGLCVEGYRWSTMRCECVRNRDWED